MKTLRELYRIGYGPSSSHTMGPRFAAERFLKRNPGASKFRVTLYGSLAATGRGHLTDWAIYEVLGRERTEIVWHPEVVLDFHPNGMDFTAIDAEGHESPAWRVFSVGGGALAEEGKQRLESPDIYDMDHLSDIQAWCDKTGKSYWEYVEECEGQGIWDFFGEIWTAMRAAVERGLEHEGILPGPLNLRRKAPIYYIKATGYGPNLQSRALVFSYALAVSEENASGGQIVTAPTCGASGVVPRRTVPYLEKPQAERHAHLPRVGHGRSGGQHRQVARVDIGRRGRLSGRGRRGLRHGRRGRQLPVRRQPGRDRVCRRNGS